MKKHQVIETVVLLLYLFLILLTAIAPPGMCACWLQPDLAENHMHLPGQQLVEHHHDYLLKMNLSAGVGLQYLVIVPILLWLAALAAMTLTWLLEPAQFSYLDWRAAPSTPPPRL